MPAVRGPIVSGMRLGLGVVVIAVLPADIKFANAGLGNQNAQFNEGEKNTNSRTQAGLDTNVNVANAISLASGARLSGYGTLSNPGGTTIDVGRTMRASA